jgi:PAS domain-containing protein
MFGYPPGTWEEGLRCFDFIAPEDRERARANMADLLRREEEQGRGGTEYAAIRADGSRFPV